MQRLEVPATGVPTVFLNEFSIFQRESISNPACDAEFKLASSSHDVTRTWALHLPRKFREGILNPSLFQCSSFLNP